MRILHACEHYHPSVGGAQEVVRQLSERLAARGHDVTVATAAHPERADERPAGVRVAGFEVAGNEVRGMTGDVDAYRRFVATGGFDVVMTYAAQQWTTDALLPVLPELPARTVVATCGFSALYEPAYERYFAGLARSLPQADRLVVHSATYRDAVWLRERGIDGVTVIPNGADEREFGDAPERPEARRLLGLPADVPVLLTVGGHTGHKGHAAVLRAMRRSRLGRGILLLVGNRPLAGGCANHCRVHAAHLALRSLGRRRARLLDLPRERTVLAYRAADLFVFASNIECSPLVLFEAAAAGTPFLSGPAGNAEEIADWTGGGEIVEATRRDGLVDVVPPALAERMDRLMADPGRRREMGDSARAAWRGQFTWDAVARHYESLYEELLTA